MNKAWYDPRVPAAEECVLRPILERWAAVKPEAVFARFEDGSTWSFSQTLAITRRTAAGLRALGVRHGDNVLSWQPTGPDALRLWFGANYLGAVYVPINTAYRGRLLEHVIHKSGAKLLFAHPGLIDRLADLDLGPLTDAVASGPLPPALPAQIRWHPAAALDADDSALGEPEQAILPWQNQTIIYTSGTTGPSKGVESSYLHLYTGSTDPFCYLDATDRYLLTLPLFHVGGTAAVYSMLVKGGSIAVIESFKVDSFWEVVRTSGATYAVLLGSMTPLLVKQPPSPADRGHGLRHAMMVPLCADAASFSQRFGCDVYTLFNMTEVSSPLLSGKNPSPLGTCGRPRAGVEARVVDANDCEVTPGAVGELIVRTDRPWAMMHAYFQEPAATARAWRNGWFHTGDGFRVDPEGNYFFVDRMKDAIRRRGENISSFEVEAEVSSHPDVQETAAVAVPSPLGEDEVLVVVVPAPGKTLDPQTLVEYLIPRMTHFMVPRYVRILPALPKTPTLKIQKHLLRTEGITADTWDREAAGVVVKRQKL